MELGDIQMLISNTIEQMKPDQLVSFVHWLEDKLGKYRMSNLMSAPTQSILAPKLNHGSRFMCSCGRSFSTEITIRETTNVETSSPPATPMLASKLEIKHHQYIQTSASKRAKTSATESSSSLIPTTTLNELVDRLHPSASMVNWHTTNLKQYEHSPELLTVESTREESDIELSSDDSRCLDEIDVVLSPDKSAVSNFIYSNSLWPTSLSPSTPTCLSYSTNHQENLQSQSSDDHLHHHHHQHQQQQQQQQQRQLATLKPIGQEPLSPAQALLHDEQPNKDLVSIHRQPILIAFIHPDVRSPTGPTHFKCTQCHETFDTLLLGQEHVNNGMCILEGLDHSDSQPSPTGSPLFDSLQENMEEVLSTRLDSKAACPICNKVFSSVHTMVRHKTSIHDRQVRYGCNICGRFFFRKDKLTSHMVYHQDFDTFVCCFCSLGCKSRMLMRQHLKRDHAISGEDAQFNEILTQCQVKKSPHSQTNTSIAYGAADRQLTTPSKRNVHSVVVESDLKPMTSN